MAKKRKGSALAVLLILVVVGVVVAYSYEARTPVVLTFMRDFVITIDPTSETIKAGSYARTTVYMTPVYTDADVTLSASGLPSAASGTFSSTSLHIAKGTTSTVSFKITTSSSTPKGSYSIKITAKVTLPTSTTPTYYDVYFSLGVDAPAPTPTPTPTPTPVKVGETWSTMRVKFKDGSYADLSSSKSQVYLMLLQTASSGKEPSLMDFAAKALTIPDIPMPYETNIFGQKIYADDFILKLETEAKILVNGYVVYTSPSEGTRVFFYKESTSWYSAIVGYPTFKLGTTQSAFSLQGFDPMKYIAGKAPGETVTFELAYKQKWEMYGWWYAGKYVKLVAGTTVQPPALKWPYTIPALEEQKPDFILSVSPASTDIGTKTGTFRTFNVAALSVQKFSSTISFSASNLPSGITTSFSRTSDTPSDKNGWIASTVLTLTASSTAKLGTYTVTVTGSGGGITHTAQISLQVKETAAPDETVLLAKTSLFLKSDKGSYAPSSTITLEGKLVDYNGNGLPSKKIELSSDFGYSGSATTDTMGEFKVEVSAPKEEGSYSIRADFKGDDKYASSSSSITVDVSKEAPTPDPFKWLLELVKSLFKSLFGWQLTDAQAILALIAIVILILLILWLMFRPRSPQIIYAGR